MTGVAERHRVIIDRIDSAARKSGRSISDITLVGVTKTLPVSLVLEGAESGLLNFGENRFQGVVEKVKEVKENLGPQQAQRVSWHFIGHIQSNKAKKIIETFDYIQSIDSLKLVNRIERLAEEIGKKVKGLLQVNISGAETQGGIPLEKLENVLESIGQLNNLEIQGFMAIGPRTNDNDVIRSNYRKFKEHIDSLRVKGYTSVGFQELSMGMSGDFDIAIEEGATIVRVGTALFGPRQQ